MSYKNIFKEKLREEAFFLIREECGSVLFFFLSLKESFRKPTVAPTQLRGTHVTVKKKAGAVGKDHLASTF